MLTIVIYATCALSIILILAAIGACLAAKPAVDFLSEEQ